jgi:hypothetical protein
MTYQSGMRAPQTGEPIPQERKIPQDTQNEHKRALLIGNIFDRIIDLTTDSRGLIQINAEMKQFDLDTVLMPNHHMPGYIREARFNNGLWVRATTKGPIRDKLHTLLLFDGQPHIYQEQRLAIRGETEHVDDSIRLSGDEEIAMLPSVEYDLGIIQERIERERADRWPHALSNGDLKFAWNAKHAA